MVHDESSKTYRDRLENQQKPAEKNQSPNWDVPTQVNPGSSRKANFHVDAEEL